MKKLVTGFTLLFLVQLSFAAMTVSIKSPGNWAKLPPCNSIFIEADYQVTEGEEIKEIRYYNKGAQVAYARSAPYTAEWKSPKAGHYELEAKIVDKNRNEAWSTEVVHVKIGDIDDHELLYNTTFDCPGSLAPWAWQAQNGAVGTVTVMDDAYFDEGGYAYFDIEEGTDTNWHMQFTQRLPLESSHTYNFYFWADADDIKPMAINIQENGGDWAVYWQQDLTIEGMDEYGPYTFECTVDDPTAVFKFLCAGNNTNWYLDNVQVLDEDFNSVKSRSLGTSPVEFELFQSYPNPFNMNTTIEYNLSQSDFAELNIVNTNGQLVKTVVSGQQSAGLHKVTWDGFDANGNAVPSGVYFYTLKAGSSSKTHAVHRKMILVK